MSNRKILDVWNFLRLRCSKEKTTIKNKSYENCFICEEWNDFEKFKIWYLKNYPKNVPKEIKFQIDKDLLQQNKEIKIYGPDTCIFLPSRINKFLVKPTKSNTKIRGVSYIKRDDKFLVYVKDFYTKKNKTVGYFKDIEKAKKKYTEEQTKINEIVKNYLKELDYLPEEIIELIK